MADTDGVPIAETPVAYLTGHGMLGKQVGRKLYIHVDSLPSLESPIQAAVGIATALLPVHAGASANVLRIEDDNQAIAFLHYPTLGSEPFPALASSWRVHLPTSLVTYRSYTQSLNPPILHRTELLLSSNHENRSCCEKLTQECESIGLFANPTKIGFRSQWLNLVREKGYELQGFTLAPIGNVSEQDDNVCQDPLPHDPGFIERHRTAITRIGLSAPVQALLRDRLLDVSTTFFDYGCGKGDDLANLEANAFKVDGWDPYFRPESERHSSQVVNLGFVLNVIEDRGERVTALEGAFALTEEVLAVAVMLTTAAPASGGRLYRDGIVTSRNTFQKYYTQGELQQFVESVTDQDAYPAAPGVVYAFKDRLVEQAYLLNKLSDRSRVSRARLNLRPRQPVRQVRETAARPRAECASPAPQVSAEATEYLSILWTRCLELGRAPDAEEYPNAPEARRFFRSEKRALTLCFSYNDEEALARAADGRRSQILIMLALQSFGKRRRFTNLEPRLQRDIKHFFGSLQSAEIEARRLLFSVHDVELIDSCCREASGLGLGWLEPGHSLQLHVSLVERLPAALRVYIGCGTALAGDPYSFDLVKIHIQSGKLSLMAFDEFLAKPLPAMNARLKVRLRDQDVDVYEYNGDYPPPLLYNKSRYINEEVPYFAEQVQFDEAAQRLGLVDTVGYGPTQGLFHRRLLAARQEIAGFELRPATTIPDLDDKCGAVFTYREFIECGSTWMRDRPNNVPTSPQTYNALHQLATSVLDPVIDYFGAIELTYGFAARALTRLIEKDIAPKIDQHAACELGRGGKHISPRQGAAVDFLVQDEDMLEVAKWISGNCAFDRMYFYGADRPLHISVGPENCREVYEMREVAGRRVPKRLAF